MTNEEEERVFVQRQKPVPILTSYYPMEDLEHLKEVIKDKFLPFSKVVVTAEWISRFNNPMNVVQLMEYAKKFKKQNDINLVIKKKWSIRKKH